jgi:hypothetical protein
MGVLHLYLLKTLDLETIDIVVYTSFPTRHCRQWAAGQSEQMAHGTEGSCVLIHNLLLTTSMGRRYRTSAAIIQG